MSKKKFGLVAEISTGDPGKIQEALIRLVGVDAMLRTDRGFRVKTTMEGQSAAELNCGLLSTLRRLEGAVALETEWTHDEKTERFFDSNPHERRKGADRRS